MRIGIDISSLQGAHRMRGIGYTTLNFLENLFEDSTDEYVFFLDDHSSLDGNEVLESIHLRVKAYQIRYFTSASPVKHFPGKLRYISKLITKFSSISVYRSGDRNYGDISDLDAFIQFDQSKPLPAGRGTKKYFIAYDLIPYILKKDYLFDYRTARQKGFNKRASLRAAIDRYAYLKKLRLNCKRANHIIAISETTRIDYIKHCKVPVSKISVVALGVSDMSPDDSGKNANGIVNRYRKTSWGYIPKAMSLKGKDFLLFVGGADERRRLYDLVTAFNHLKAQGSNLKLVLSGDIMKGPLDIPVVNIQKSLLRSSYLDDIYFVGFTDDSTRNWLYKHAIAFVFPSVYEGFGLPVLEAMSLRTPVVCYNNRAVKEVASTIPFYANNSLGLVDRIREIQVISNNQTLQDRLDKGVKHAKKYSWRETTKGVVELLRA